MLSHIFNEYEFIYTKYTILKWNVYVTRASNLSNWQSYKVLSKTKKWKGRWRRKIWALQCHWMDWKILHKDSGIGTQDRHIEGTGQMLGCVAGLQPHPISRRRRKKKKKFWTELADLVYNLWRELFWKRLRWPGSLSVLVKLFCFALCYWKIPLKLLGENGLSDLIQ